MNAPFGEDAMGTEDTSWLRSERSIIEETRSRLSHVRGALQTLCFGVGAVTDYSAADGDDEALEVLQVARSDVSQLLLGLTAFPLTGVHADVFDMRSRYLPTSVWVKREAWMRSSGGGCRSASALREVVERLVPLVVQLVATLDDLRDHESIREWHNPDCWVRSPHRFNLFAIAEKMHGEAKVLLGELQMMQVALVLAVQVGQVAADGGVANAAAPASERRTRAA